MKYQRLDKGLDGYTGLGGKINAILIIILILCALVASMLNGCTHCQIKAVEDAKQYRAEGNETRVCAYTMTAWGRLVGMNIWKSHLQAQVKKDERWVWVGEVGLSDEPTFGVKNGEVWCWTVEGYEALLADYAAHPEKYEEAIRKYMEDK